MPELPDVTLYVEALRERVVGATLTNATIRSPFLLRTFDPPIDDAEGRAVVAVERLGKRIVVRLEGGLSVVVHLMIAGRFLWKPAGTRPTSKVDLAAFDFDADHPGSLLLCEAGTKKRAALHVMTDETLGELDRGGLDVLSCSGDEFDRVLRAESRTVKRRLTDPRAFDGIGNAYSDEILHAAKVSPVALTRKLSDDDTVRLHTACKSVLTRWTDTLLDGFRMQHPKGPHRYRFPGRGDITAFRPDFAVHGRFGEPCPVCSSPVQRIVRADNECNYCPGCQTGGRVLADRSLSRLLKDDWPRTIEEWEAL